MNLRDQSTSISSEHPEDVKFRWKLQEADPFLTKLGQKREEFSGPGQLPWVARPTSSQKDGRAVPGLHVSAEQSRCAFLPAERPGYHRA